MFKWWFGESIYGLEREGSGKVNYE